MRKPAGCLIAALELLLPVAGALNTRGDEIVAFPDPVLKAAVEDALWVVDPTASDMLALIELSYVADPRLRELQMADLTGLEYATNLQRLDLRLNRLEDLKPLSTLTHLQSLDLSCNRVHDLTSLSGLHRLRSVDLHQNYLSNLSAVSGLHNVERLSLRFNKIRDLTPLSCLTELRELDLHGNVVSDLSPLCALTSLRNVDLRGNPLSWESYEICMPRISANNPAACIICDPPPEWNAVHVDDDAAADVRAADSDEDGTAERPFDRIQEAIDAAGPGSLILVHPGTYRDTIHCSAKGIQLTGIHADEGSGPLFPVIEGGLAGPVVQLSGPSEHMCRLSGLIIMAGRDRTAGAILCDGVTAALTNCLIVGNRLMGLDGAIIYAIDGDLVMTNCTIADNEGGPETAAITLVDSHLRMTNSILWNKTPAEILPIGSSGCDLRYSTIRGSWGGTGCIDDDPQFVRSGVWIDPENADAQDIHEIWRAGDYHLKSCQGRWDSDTGGWTRDERTSPCIDAGDPESLVGDEPVPNGGIVNVGAYGGTRQASKSSIAGRELDEQDGVPFLCGGDR